MRYILSLLAFVLISSVHAETFTVGRQGINSAGFVLPNGQRLDGEGVGVGMVENNRPGKDGYDQDPDKYHQAVNPHRVFVRSSDAGVNANIDDHAEGVAGVIIGDGSFGGYSLGVAPDAKLYAGASNFEFNDAQLMQTFHKIVTFPVSASDPDVKVITTSHFVSLAPPNEILMDGNYDLTQYIDWSADRHDITYVVLGPSLAQATPASPTDNFNGITVGASQTSVESGHEIYRESAYLNKLDEGFDADGDRVSIDILAPGVNIQITKTGNTSETVDGTSFAAPHVAGAVALLQQYGNWKVQHQGWNGETAPRHELMKAVILNSADKIKGIHGALRSVRAINDSYSWQNSPAATDISIPLDPWFGAGHLNFGAALKQYRAGEWEAGVVPNIGWDYGSIGSAGSYNIYYFNRPLAAGEVVAATLCWDLRVETINPNPNNYFDGFFDYQDLSQVLNDLDIYLMPAGADPDNSVDIIDASVSSVDNVEHIFFPIQTAGLYQLVVANTSFGIGDAEDYGLAWWAGEGIPGDFDGDGDVDGNDLPNWKTGFGTSEADADNDGDSDGGDFLAWQRNLGFNVPLAVVVPEPSSWLLCCLGLPLLRLRRRATRLSVDKKLQLAPADLFFLGMEMNMRCKILAWSLVVSGLAAPIAVAGDMSTQAIVTKRFDPASFDELPFDLDPVTGRVVDGQPGIYQIDLYFTAVNDSGDKGWATTAFSAETVGSGLELNTSTGGWAADLSTFDSNGPAPGGVAPVYGVNADAGPSSTDYQGVLISIGSTAYAASDGRSRLGASSAPQVVGFPTHLGALFVDWIGEGQSDLLITDQEYSFALTNNTFGVVEDGLGASAGFGATVGNGSLAPGGGSAPEGSSPDQGSLREPAGEIPTIEPPVLDTPPEPRFPNIIPTFELPSNDRLSALVEKRSHMGDVRFSGVLLSIPDSAWPLPLPSNVAVSQIPEPSAWLMLSIVLSLLRTASQRRAGFSLR